MPTYEVGSGQTYADVNAAITAIGNDPAAGAYTINLHGEDCGGGATTNFTITNANNATFVIQAAAGVGVKDKGGFTKAVADDTTVARLAAVTGATTLNISTSNVTLKNVLIKAASAQIGVYTNNGVEAQHCLVVGGDYGVYQVGDWVGGLLLNCGFYGQATNSVVQNASGSHGEFIMEHCASVPIISRNAGDLTCRNCMSVGAYQGVNGGDYDVAADASAPGANSWQNQSNFFTDVTAGAWDLHIAVGAAGSYPCADRTATYPVLLTDMDGDARPVSGADAGADVASATDPPNATYAADSQPCEGSNGTITPTNTGGAITSAAVASGTLPTGYVLNADGTISKTGANMVVGDIGTRTVYVNLTNGAGTQSNVPVPITITANPPVLRYADSPFTKYCGYAPSTANVTATGPAVVAAGYALDTALGGLALNTTTGQLTFDPDLSEGTTQSGVTRTISGTSAGGQVGTTTITVKFGYQFTVEAGNAGGTDTGLVTMWLASGMSGESTIELGERTLRIFAVDDGGLRITFSLGNRN